VFSTKKVPDTTPLGVVTVSLPVDAPAGTVVVTSVEETTVNTAGVPLKLTLLAPARLLPKMMTGDPTMPV
jgi:hypothetical protein